MIDEVCTKARVELHDAWATRVVIDMLRAEVVIHLMAFREGSEEKEDVTASFCGVKWVSVEELSLGSMLDAGERIDVGEGFPPAVVRGERSPVGVVWVFFARSNGFIMMQVETIKLESARGCWSSA